MMIAFLLSIKNPLTEEIIIENLDHLKIVAWLINEIGIVEIIDQKLGIDNQEKIATRQVIKAVVLNGSGMTSSPLYYSPNPN